MVEMMQKAAFWNIPLAIAAVGGYLEDYFNIVQGYKAIFLWYFPGDRYLAESAAGDPKRILFPMRDPSSYSPRNYTAGSGMWDIGGFMGVSKDLSSLAPAVDSFVSKVNVTIEQLTEIVRQHKQIGGTHLDEDDKMYSLACDWLKNNPWSFGWSRHRLQQGQPQPQPHRLPLQARRRRPQRQRDQETS